MNNTVHYTVVATTEDVCAECGHPTSTQPDDPREWSLTLPVDGQLGVTRRYHIRCVMRWKEAASVTPFLMNEALAAMSGAGVATPLGGYLRAPFELAANINQLAKERDDLRAVLKDTLETAAVADTSLQKVRALLLADGCWECAYPSSALHKARQNHHHAPVDRASAYRMLLGPADDVERPLSHNVVRDDLLRLLTLILGDR